MLPNEDHESEDEEEDITSEVEDENGSTDIDKERHKTVEGIIHDFKVRVHTK